VITAAVASVPESWFTVSPPEIYVEYLTARLAASAKFSLEAESAR
jgi:hypothetical protein